MRKTSAQLVAPITKRFEHLFNGRMIDRPGFRIAQQILLTDIGDVAVLVILGEEVIEGLFTRGAQFGRDRFVPFFAVGKDRVDIENHPAKIEEFVADDIANGKARFGNVGCRDLTACLR